MIALDPGSLDGARVKVAELIRLGCPCIVVLGVGRANGTSFMMVSTHGDSAGTVADMTLAATILQQQAVAEFFDEVERKNEP